VNVRRWLEELDERRYTNPHGAYENLVAGVDDVPAELAPLWCGVVGSCLRLMGQYDHAIQVLRTGVEHADKALDHFSAGDLHQRLSMVYWNKTEYDQAYLENCAAIARYLEIGDEIRIARCFVHRGTFLYEMGEKDWSFESFQRATRDLPETEQKFLAAAHHGLAIVLRDQDGQLAAQHLQAAATYTTDPSNQAKLSWAAANALADVGEIKSAESLFCESIETLSKTAPIEAALATIDFAEILLKNARPDDAHRVAAGMHSLIGRLRGDRIAQGVATKLARIGVTGTGMTRAQLARARARVKTTIRRPSDHLDP
jgi:hypothetical protein